VAKCIVSGGLSKNPMYALDTLDTYFQSVAADTPAPLEPRGAHIFTVYVGSRSGERWIERLAGEDGFESGEQRLALLAQGREVAA
jgi:hypothetical protein